MHDNDKELFLQWLTLLAESFNRKMSNLLLETYWQCLRAYPFAKVKAAILDILRNPDREVWGMPIAAELIELIQGNSRQFAQNAWAQVIHTIRTIGRYNSVVFDNPIIHCVIRDVGGWIYLCQQSEKTLSFLRQDFITRYQKYHANPSINYPRVLRGSLEHDNEANGFANSQPDPMLVGDPKRALLVYKNGSSPLEVNFPLSLSKATQQFESEK
ncbi:DUF6475 domain-containing protein [Rickettsiella endosymbiont of Dermanyssus gallinae]|uniref:DUF6475 domain-containing protein n=1 Tax=Rickettsiella endosymbiont of Dermanyssus gallinae TaxID=2856608 RepID=UPI001C52773E|nr:DUF6475 domain-containing protein [Rickettsiella endosymbiont of Dermanyssus gallinae]